MDMNKKTRIRMGFEKYEAEKIHNEIFSNSTEHQYYTLGVAQGLYFIYKTFYNLQNKDTKFSREDLLEIIKYPALNDENIKKYFERLLLDIDI